jgi:integrase
MVNTNVALYQPEGKHMIGSRPLTNDEITSVLRAFSGTYAARDRALFVIGLKSGFRISEMLSLRVQDVWRGGKVVEAVSVAQKRMKGKVSVRGESR